jgi:putative PIN family toxin of toxin-antitoxin system
MAARRIVLDTSVLVSGLAYPGSIPGRIVGAWRNGAIDAVLSRYILAELVRVLPRLNHRLRLSENDILDLVDALALLADLVDPVLEAEPVSTMLLRDPADLPVLGTLLASGADYLVTMDKDLLALAERHSILTPAQFWTRHGQ